MDSDEVSNISSLSYLMKENNNDADNNDTDNNQEQLQKKDNQFIPVNNENNNFSLDSSDGLQFKVLNKGNIAPAEDKAVSSKIMKPSRKPSATTSLPHKKASTIDKDILQPEFFIPLGKDKPVKHSDTKRTDTKHTDKNSDIKHSDTKHSDKNSDIKNTEPIKHRTSRNNSTKYPSIKKFDNRNSMALDYPPTYQETDDNPKTFPKRKSTSDTAEIVYKSQSGTTKVIQLKNPETTIGRKLESDISLHCPKVSKLHAIIKKIDGGYAILDSKSANGVRINDRHIPQSTLVKLEHDDKISVGSYTLTFKSHHSVNKDDPFTPNNITNEPDCYSLDKTASILDPPKQHRQSITDKKNAPYDKAERAKARSLKTRSILDSSKKKTPTVDDHRYTRLVTIVPSEKQNEGAVTIQAEIDAEPDTEFRPFHEVKNMDTIQEDYEKLRLAYELSKSFSLDITEALSKSCEIMFEILPLDRAVVLLVDSETKMLVTHYVRVRKSGMYSQSEICLSSTILRKVYHSRKALITSDAFEDPMLNRHASVKHGQIRSVICVPLMTRDKVLGVLHLDSRNKIVNLSKKDLSLVIAVGSQTAMAIENSILVKEVEKKAKLTQQFSRFLPPYVVDKMTKKGGEGVSKGGRDTFGTIVFSDIRGFTSFSEKTVPSEVVNLLNDYFERLVAIVFKYNGIVDKYIGDALMAAFGTMEHERMDSEYRAVSAALEFKKAIEEMNEERKKVNREPIAVGIGLNTGELLSGFIGCSQRLEYTCIGDTVNTSSRICSMAGVNQILMSESTWEAVKDRVVSTPVGYKHFKGKNKEVMVYEPICFKK